MAVYQGSLTVKRRPKDGVPGNPGLPGQVPLQKEWVAGDTHRFNNEVKDFIYVKAANSNTLYWYTRTNKGDVTAGTAPVGGASVTGYTRVTGMEFLATRVLLAEKANLANFIFKDEQLISVRGTVNNVEVDYSGQAGFVPNITLDGKTGAAYFGAKKIMFNPDGTGKIGVFEIDEIGSVKIYDPDIADLLRLEFVKSKVPTVASLMSQTEAGQSKTNTARMFYSSSGSATLPNSVTVTEEGAELSFQGMMELYADFSELNGATSGSAYVGVALYKDGFNYAALGNISSGQLNNSNSHFSNYVQLNKKLTVQKGVYTIVVSASFSNALGSAGINNTSTLSWILRKDIRRFIFGSDGFASWYTENSFHFSELTGMFARGKVDIPAGLGGGRVTAGSGVNTPWGLVTGGARASNVVTINHNIGDTRYTVNVALNENSSPWYFQNRTNTSIQVVCSGAFDFTLIRTPV